MFIPTIIFSTWYLKYRGVYVYSGTKVSNANTAMRELHPFNNKELRSNIEKLDASVLELTGSKARWYSYMYSLNRTASLVDIGSSVLMLHGIYGKGGGMKITGIVPNINPLTHIIPPPHRACI